MSNNKQWDPSQQEKNHFLQVISSMKQYRTVSLEHIEKIETYLNSLSKSHQEYLKSYKKRLENIKPCINRNNEIIKLIIDNVSSVFNDIYKSKDTDEKKIEECIEMDQIINIFKQIARDWSVECKEERNASYNPIVQEIESRYHLGDPSKMRILVPGAGLGRLSYEIAMKGYTCQGNDYSLYMLLASNFILNKCNGTNVYTVHPWLHQFSNNLTVGDQTKEVVFPDVNPSVLKESGHFSMVAGDFLEVYKQSEEWDCIATCFFIDCGNNIVACIENIFNILKQGGIWINLGPLLYDFSDESYQNPIEPCYEELRQIIIDIGFKYEKEEKNLRTSYTQNPRSMARSEYLSVFFVCRKIKPVKK